MNSVHHEIGRVIDRASGSSNCLVQMTSGYARVVAEVPAPLHCFHIKNFKQTTRIVYSSHQGTLATVARIDIFAFLRNTATPSFLNLSLFIRFLPMSNQFDQRTIVTAVSVVMAMTAGFFLRDVKVTKERPEAEIEEERKGSILRSSEESLDAREKALELKQALLDSNLAAVETREKLTTEREEELKALAGDLESREGLVASMEAVLVNQRAEIAAKEAGLINREATIAAKETELVNLAAEITAKQTDLGDRYATIEAKEADLINRETAIAAKEADLGNRYATIEAKEANLIKQEGTIASKQTDLISGGVAMASRSDELVKVVDGVKVREVECDNEEFLEPTLVEVATTETADSEILQVETEKDKRIRMIKEELTRIVKQAEEEDFGGEEMEHEAVEALEKAAMLICFRKKYYDVMKDELIYFPSVGKSMLNGDLFEAAEPYYFDEEDEFPLEYSGSLKAAVSTILSPDELDLDEDYMSMLALDVET